MPKTDLFSDPGEYLKCVFSRDHCDLTVVPIHNPDGSSDNGGLAGMYEVQYRMSEGAMRHSDKVNVTIGIFTTAHARLHLYAALEDLGEQVLYFDTDSVIYEHDALNDAHVHLTSGDYLGEFKDELTGGAYITRFVSGGPKNYGYVLNIANTGATEFVKIKGFHLKHPNAASRLSLKVMEGVVRERGAIGADEEGVERVHGKRKVTLQLETIARDKRRKVVVNRTVRRSYQFVYDKGEVQADYSVLPFGHRGTHRGDSMVIEEEEDSDGTAAEGAVPLS
jgi:hypothetical protein